MMDPELLFSRVNDFGLDPTAFVQQFQFPLIAQRKRRTQLKEAGVYTTNVRADPLVITVE